MKLHWLLGLIWLLFQVAFGNTVIPILYFEWSSPVPNGSNLKGTCLGGDKALLSTGVWLSYNATYNDGVNYTFDKVHVRYNTSAPTLFYQNISELHKVIFFFYQPEHGGGKCHCLTVHFNNDKTWSRTLCDGIATSPRILNITWTLVGTTRNPSINIIENPESTDGYLNDVPFLLHCTKNQTRLNISFTVLTSNKLSCDPLDKSNSFGEGIELSIKLSSIEEWIPLMYLFVKENFRNIFHRYNYYSENIHQVTVNQAEKFYLEICNFKLNDSMRFRWLQTSYVKLNKDYPRDIWSLDNIYMYLKSNGENLKVFADSFEDYTKSMNFWKQDFVRNGVIANYCSNNSMAMVFGQNSIDTKRRGYGLINSRGILTPIFNLCNISHYKQLPECSTEFYGKNSTVTTETPITTGNGTVPTTSIVNTYTSGTKNLTIVTTTSHAQADKNYSTTVGKGTTEAYTSEESSTTVSKATTDKKTQSDEEAIMSVTSEAIEQISKDQELQQVYNTTDTTQKLILLRNITTEGDKPVVATTYLLYNTLAAISAESNVTDNSAIELAVEISNDIVTLVADGASVLTETSAAVVGTSLLLAIDQVALLSTQPETYSASNIFLNVNVTDISTTNPMDITSLDTSSLNGWHPPHTSITLPDKELAEFAVNITLSFSATSFRQASTLFPKGLEDERVDLMSDVVGTSIHCGDSICPTGNLDLTSPVQISFKHSHELMELLNSSSSTRCVFLDIPERNGSTLNLGRWSSRGCEKNLKMSSNKRTVCECDHLTHFAILLSPSPPEFSRSVNLSLSYIGYIGVAISVVAMAITVLSFVMLRSLHTMRNYITVNLCISLSIAQVLFVTGANRTGSSNTNVPIQCQIIAVLLHYFFLVSFMWMLMEGVFLYLTLVKVFFHQTKRYLTAFTIISYGGPVLYMGALTLPLGFALPGGTYYGYEKACFLRPDTYFMWAFIAPVILILLVNMGFFIMAGVIMWRHQKKQTDKTRTHNVCSWLKSAISLVVIMGLTWILGLLVVELDELASLAFVYTIMVAFQGLLIFLIYTVFSKVVRQAYIKWWKNQVNNSEILSKYFGESLTSSTKIEKASKASSKSSNNGNSKVNPSDYSMDTTYSNLSNFGSKQEKQNVSTVKDHVMQFAGCAGDNIYSELRL